MNVLSNRLVGAAINLIRYKEPFVIQQRFCQVVEKLRQEYLKAQAKPKPPCKHPLGGKPQAKGIILKTLIKKPRKPNSANRKCVLVKLSTGKEMVAYIPGEGHNLQDHQVVLVEPKKLKDVPGVKLRCIRGKYDLSHVKKEQKQ